MANLLLPVFQVKNVSPQILSIKVDPDLTSPIYPSSRNIVSIRPQQYVEFEQRRGDEEQLNNLRRKNLLVVTPLTRLVESGGGTSGGSE